MRVDGVRPSAAARQRGGTVIAAGAVGTLL